MKYAQETISVNQILFTPPPPPKKSLGSCRKKQPYISDGQQEPDRTVTDAGLLFSTGFQQLFFWYILALYLHSILKHGKARQF